MKQAKIFKVLFAKGCLVAIGVLFFLPTAAQAAMFSLASTNVTSSSATVTIKTSTPQSVQSVNIILIDAQSQMNQGQYDISHAQPLPANGTFTEKFTGLASGTKYTVRVLFTGPAYINAQVESIGFVTTSGATPTPPNPPSIPPNTPPLPAKFLTDQTVIKNGSVTLSIENTASFALQLDVIAVSTLTGSAIADRTVVVQAGSTGQVFFTTDLHVGQTYDFQLLGKKLDGANYGAFQKVLYSGVKITDTPVSGTSGQAPSPVITTPTNKTVSGPNECNDGVDNNGDGKADSNGVYAKDGTLVYEPDPSCFSNTARRGFAADGSPVRELNDDVSSSIIPCTDKCTFSDVFKLINNLLSFFVQQLLIPIFIFLIMWAGFKYITAQGNASKKANLRKLFGNMILGIVLILCSWLIVHTILVALGYTEGLLFFD